MLMAKTVRLSSVFLLWRCVGTLPPGVSTGLAVLLSIHTQDSSWTFGMWAQDRLMDLCSVS